MLGNKTSERKGRGKTNEKQDRTPRMAKEEEDGRADTHRGTEDTHNRADFS